MTILNILRHIRDAYCDSPDAIHLCDFSPEFATAWQDPTRREALCELARRFLRETNQESDWTVTSPSNRHTSLFLAETVFVIHDDYHHARHNIREDFLNRLNEQPDNTTPTTTTQQ